MKGDIKGAIMLIRWFERLLMIGMQKKGYNISLFMEDLLLPKQEDI
jgi:hypothetical protein